MKVSIVSVVLNCRDYIGDCILSVIGQDYSEIEYIVIDGGSTDGTLDVIQQYQDRIHVFITQKDQGFYDGLNKGIALATGDIIGILNADDMIAEPGTISMVVRCFATTLCGGVYGNLEYTDRKNIRRVVRSWRPEILDWKDSKEDGCLRILHCTCTKNCMDDAGIIRWILVLQRTMNLF